VPPYLRGDEASTAYFSLGGRIEQIQQYEPEFWPAGGPIDIAEYHRQFDEFLNAQSAARQIVYHYTTLPGFLGMVKDGHIWASDVRTMNDRAELRYAMSHMCAALEAQHPALKVALRGIFHGAKTWRFASCFSFSADQLSQWRAYGSEVGISIGFDRSHLERMASHHEAEFSECRYFKPDEFARLLPELQPIADALQHSNAINADGALTDVALQSDLQKQALKIASSIKHYSFEEEQEVRLIAPTERTGSHIAYRGTDRAIVPYRCLELDSRRRGVATRERFRNFLGMIEVLVWPNDADEQILDAIDMVLHDAGKVWISRSASPYRT
jgi:hypothetical protein